MERITASGYTTQAYADDIMVTVRCKHESSIIDRMQHALSIIEKWCEEKWITVNPSKTTLIPFTRRTNLNLRAQVLNGQTLKFFSEA